MKKIKAGEGSRKLDLGGLLAEAGGSKRLLGEDLNRYLSWDLMNEGSGRNTFQRVGLSHAKALGQEWVGVMGENIKKALPAPRGVAEVSESKGWIMQEHIRLTRICILLVLPRKIKSIPDTRFAWGSSLCQFPESLFPLCFDGYQM